MHCLITAGPTREHLDPVRFLSNGSSGKMGYALAAAAVARGWTVELVSGPVALVAPEGVRLTRVVSAAEMLAACAERFPACDLFMAVAAVADYRPVHRQVEKGGKQTGRVSLELEPTPDILRTLAAGKRTDQLVVGFAAETSDLAHKARRKLVEKNCDWIVGNDVSAPGLGMEADNNAVTLWNRAGDEWQFGPAPKTEIARSILATVVALGA